MNKLLHLHYYLPLAIGDVATKVFSPAVWTRLCDKPAAALHIPDDFFGINIASSEDELCDDYVMDRLRELDITNVRLAFSYCSFDGHTGRFLDKLLDNRFAVSLVVLPPLDEAKKMLSDRGAREQWRCFVGEVFNRYGGRVAVFEIGSTPNRRKWSGFGPRSYLQAWKIACDEAGKHSVALAGPNVQDFEPFYNAGILFAMRRMGRVPDIHTNNLFVERVIEPEAYDHRVLGKWATRLLKLNLVKKARLLQSLGEKAGCRQTISTCKFWTTKRLSRWSLYPQDKKVDYLARYLVLAATSGALGRVYWGPMICSRDGLIDDRAVGYPEIDHSSFYRRVRGDVANFSVTPAFFALGYVAQRLRSARCYGAVSGARGLSHFAFTGSGNEVFHVCWCRDGQALRLTDLYSEEQLAAAVFTDACGKIVPSALAVNERPLFVDFPGLSSQQLPERLPQLRDYGPNILYACLPGFQGVPWHNRYWQGAFAMTDECAAPSLGDDLMPDKLPEQDVPRDRRRHVWHMAHPFGHHHLTVTFNRPRGIERLVGWFKPSQGRRHWNAASILLRRGIGTPTPIAFYERRRGSGGGDSYYICEFIADAFSSAEVFNAFRQGRQEFRGLDKHRWFDLLAGYICKVHNAGIIHRDLLADNLLLKEEVNGEITPYLIGMGRAEVVKGGLGGRKRLLDLGGICSSLGRPDRELFLGHYSRCWGRTFSPWWRPAAMRSQDKN